MVLRKGSPCSAPRRVRHRPYVLARSVSPGAAAQRRRRPATTRPASSRYAVPATLAVLVTDPRPVRDHASNNTRTRHDPARPIGSPRCTGASSTPELYLEAAGPVRDDQGGPDLLHSGLTNQQANKGIRADVRPGPVARILVDGALSRGYGLNRKRLGDDAWDGARTECHSIPRTSCGVRSSSLRRGHGARRHQCVDHSQEGRAATLPAARCPVR